MRARHAQRPNPLGALVAIFIGIAMLVVIGEVAARVLFPQWREFFNGYFMRSVPVPNHRAVTIGTPGWEGYFSQNNGDFRHHIRINQHGQRNDEPVEAADGAVWVVGDSMAFGWGVEREDNYTAVIGREAKVRTYNVASPGEDVCGYQSLIARMPANVLPRAVIIGVILENDIHEYDCVRATEASLLAPPPLLEAQGWSHGFPTDLLSVKYLLTQTSALYNFVAVASKRLPVMEGLLVGIGIINKPHAFKATTDESHLQQAISKTAYELERARAMLPKDVPMAVLIAPSRFELRDDDALYRHLRVALGKALAEKSIPVIDPIEPFKAAGFEPTHFIHDGHWSPLGHKIAGALAAQWVSKALQPQ
jgi:hypothetical protein